jgi:hypothetical protein
MSTADTVPAPLVIRLAERRLRRRRRRAALVHNEAARALRSPTGRYRRRVAPSARRYRRHPRHRRRVGDQTREFAIDNVSSCTPGLC